MPLHGEIIVIKRNGTDGTHFPLTATSCLFGRKAECDIRIQLPHVSKEHCKVEVRDNGEVFVTNLSSVNPTQLNGTTVKKPVCLKHGDVLTIIDRSFRFEKPPTQQGKRRSTGLDSETFKVFASNHPSDTNETVRIETLINKTQRKSEGNIIKTTHSRRSLQVSSSSLPRSDLSPFGELYEMLKSKVEIGKTPVKDKSSSPKNVALKRSLQMQDGSESPVSPKRSSRSQSSDSPLTRPKEVALEPRSASAGRVREASKSPSRSPKTSTKDLNKSLQKVEKEPEATTRRRSKRDSHPESHEPVHPIVNGYEEKRSPRRSASAEESKLEFQIQSSPANAKTTDSPTPRRRGTQSASKLVLKNPDSSPQGKSPTQGRRSETLEKSPKRTPSAASVSEGNASEEVEPRKTPRKRRSDELSLPEPPPKRKRVSFGGHLSPELFDKRLPPNSPLKKGATPARRSLPLNSTRTVIRKSFGLKQSVIREVFEQSAGKSPNVSRSSPTRSSPVKRSPAKQSPLAKSLSPSKSSVSVKSPAGAQTSASVTPVKNSPAKKSTVEMPSFSAKLIPVKQSPSAKSPDRSLSRSPKGLSLKPIPTTPAKTPSERSPVARMPSSLKRSPVGETPTSAVRSPVARTPSPSMKSPMASSPAKRSPVAKTPSPAKRSPVAKTPSPAKRSPVAKTPSPIRRSPVAKTPSSVRRSPVAKTPSSVRRSPVAKTPSSVRRSPVAKTPSSVRRSPVAKTPSSVRRSPVAKTPSSVRRSPVAKTPSSVRRSPVAKTPSSVRRSPVAKTPSSVRRSPVAKTPSSVRRSPVAKTPSSVRRSPVAKTPSSVRRSPVAKTPSSVRRSPVAKTPTSVRRSSVTKTPSPAKLSPVAKTPTPVKRSPVAKMPTSVRRSLVAKTPTSVRRSLVAKTPISVRRSPVSKTPTPVKRSPVAKTPTSVRRSSVTKTPSPAKRSPVAKTPTSVRRSPVVKTPTPVKRSPVAKTPTPVKRSPVAKTPTPVKRSPVAKTPTPVKRSPVAKTPTPVKRSPVAKTPTPVKRSPVAKTPTPVKRSPVAKTPTPVKRSPVAKTPTPVKRSPVAKTPTPVKRSPVAKTPTPVKRSPVAKTPTPVKRSPVAKTPTPVKRSPVAKTPTPVKRSPVAKTPTPVKRSPVAKTPTSVRRSSVTKTPSPAKLSPVAKMPTSVRRFPVAKTPTSVRRSPVAKTPTPAKRPPVAKTPTPVKRSPVAKMPTSVRRSPVAKTPTPVTPYMKGRFSVSRIGTPPQEQVQSDLPASQTPKTSRKSLSMRKTPRRSRKLEAFELIRSRRRSGATEANLLVSKTWADVVKVGVAKSQRTINKPAQKIVAIKKKLKHKTPMKKIKDVTSTGHADSPATILVGRAHTRVVNLTGFVPKVVRNQAVRLDPAHNESFTGVAELFSTPPNIKPRKSNRLETSKTESPSSVLVEVSAMQTPEESGEMVVSPLDSPKTTRRKQYSRDAVSRLLQSPASPELRNEDGSATVEITAGTSKSQKNSRKSMGLSGIKRIMKTPKQKGTQVTDPHALRKLLRTPTEPESSRAYSRRSTKLELLGIDRLLKTPKEKPAPVEDFTGVQRIMKTPKQKAEPVQDFVGVKRLTRTPKEKVQLVEDLVGVKQMMRTPKEKSLPVEDMVGIKRIMRTPKVRCQPIEDMIGIKRIMKTPKERGQPVEDIALNHLLSTPTESVQSTESTRPIEEIFGIKNLIKTPPKSSVSEEALSKDRGSRSAKSAKRGRPAKRLSLQVDTPSGHAAHDMVHVQITQESVTPTSQEVKSAPSRGRPSMSRVISSIDVPKDLASSGEITLPKRRGRPSSAAKSPTGSASKAEKISPTQRRIPKAIADEPKEFVPITDGKVTSPARKGRPSTTVETPKESVSDAVSEATSSRRRGRPSSKAEAPKESLAIFDLETVIPTVIEVTSPSHRGRRSSTGKAAEITSPAQRGKPKSMAEESKESGTIADGKVTSTARKGRPSITSEAPKESVVSEATSPKHSGRPSSKSDAPKESPAVSDRELASPTQHERLGSRRGRPSSSTLFNDPSTSPAPKGRQSTTKEVLEVPEVTSPSRHGRAIKTTAPGGPEESAPSVETKLTSPSRRGRPSSSVVTNASSLSTSPAPKGRQSTTTEALEEVPEVTSPSRRGRAIKTTAPGPEESAPSVETKLASPSRRGRPSSSVVTNASSLSTSPAPKGRQSTTTEALEEVPEVTLPSHRGRAIKTTAPGPEESAPSVETKLASPSRRGRPSSSVVTNASSLSTSPAPKGRQSTTTEALEEVPEVTSPSRRGRAIKTTAPGPEDSAPSVETKLASPSRRGRPSSSVVTSASSLSTSPAPKGRQSTTTEALEEVPEVTSPSRRGRAIKTTAPGPEESAPSVETKLASPSRRGRPSSSVVTNASSLSTSPAPKGRQSTTTEALEEVPEVTSPSRRGRAIKTPGPEESAPSVETKLASSSRRGRPSSSVVTNASSLSTSPAPKGRQSTTIEALEEVPEVTSPSRRGRAIKTTTPGPEESAPSVETKLASPSRRGRPSSSVVTNASSLSTSPAPKGRQSTTTEALEEVPEVTSPSRRGRAIKTTTPGPEESAPSVETKLASPSRRGRPSSSAVNNASSLSTSPAPKGRQSSTTKALEKSIPVPAVTSPVRRGRPIKSSATDKSVTAETQLTSRSRRGKQSPSAVTNESVLPTSPALKERLSTSTEVLKDVTAVTSPNRRGRPKKGTVLEESIPTVETKLTSLAHKKKPSTLLENFQDPATDKDHPVLVSEGKTTSQTRRGRQKAAEEFPQESSAPALQLTRASRSEISAEVSELSEQLPSTQSRRGRQKASAQVSEVLVSSPTRRSKSKDISEAPKDSVPSVTEATSQKSGGRRKMPDVTKESNSVTDGKTTAPKQGTRSKVTVDASGESGPAVEEVTSHTRRGRARKMDMPKEPEVTSSVQEANTKSANDVSEVASTRKGRSRKTEVSRETVPVSEVTSPKRRRKPDISEGDYNSSLEREQPVILPVHTSPVTRRGGRRKNTEEFAVAEPDATKPKTSKQVTRGRVQSKAKGVTEVKESSDSADEPTKSPEPKSPKESAEQAKDLATENQPKSLRGRPRKSKANSPEAGSETVVPEVKVPHKSTPARGRSRAARDISDASDDQTQESSLPATKPQRGSRRNQSVPDRSSATHKEPAKLLSADVTESTTKSTRGKKASDHDGPQPAPEVKGRKNARGTTLQNVEELVISKSKAKSVQWHPLLATDIQSTADEVTAQESNEASARGGRSKGKAKPDVPEPQIPVKRSRRGNIKEAEETPAASGPESPTVLDAAPRKRGKGANVQLEDTEAKSTNETTDSTKVKSPQLGRRAALNVLNAENNEEHKVQLSTSRRQRGTATSKTSDEKESAHSPVKDKRQKGVSGKSNDDGKSPKSTRGVKRKLPNADANIPLPEERERLSPANKSVLVETENIPAGRGRKNQRNAKTQKSEVQEVPLVKLAVTSESPAKRRKTEAATTAAPKRSSRQQTSKPDIEKPSAAAKTRTSTRSRK